MTRKLNVILIQDKKEIIESIKSQLEENDYELYFETVDSLESLKDVIQRKTWDVVISDYRLKNINCLEALIFIKKYDAFLSFILLSEEIDCNSMVKLMKNGCNNYVNKEEISKLANIIESEVNIAKIKKEKNRLFENLKYAEESVKLTIENIGVGIITTDNTGKIININKTAERFIEWNKNNVFGMEIYNVFKLIDSNSKETLKCPFHRLINKIQSSDLIEDVILVSKNGKEYNISVNFSLIIDKQNKVLGMVIVFNDITKIKALENELRKEKEAAQAENMAKSLFLANMSHEIRTPLNGIDGMIDLTLRTELTHEQKENLIIAKDCSNSLMEVINNILDFSKIEAGKIVLKKTQFSIKELLKNTIKTNIVHAREKDIELICNINQGMDEVLYGDYGRIQQILNNLISNAIKFTDRGSVCVEVKNLSEEKDSSLFRFSVKDTGIGIAQEDIDKLFKSFSQVDGTYTRKYGGTGLGLIISKRLAELMGGEISLESTKGKGSIFYLTIRIEKNISLPEEKKIDKYDHQDYKISNISKKILIVEDNKANQKVLSKMCEKMNNRVKVADDGRKALEILKDESFDLILMDIQMPVMDGIMATRIIRENEKKYGEHIPIVAVTAYALKGDREKFLSLGMDGYLSKPIIMNDLYECIENIMIKQNSGVFHNAEYYLNICESNNNSEDKIDIVENMHMEIDKLKEAISKEDFNSCENIAHTLKECASAAKLQIIKNSSFRAELAARRKDIKALEDQLVVIEEEYIRNNKN